MAHRDITIIGAGYVGLTAGAVFAKLGHRVWVVDREHSKIAMLKAGKVPFFEPELPELVKTGVRRGRLIPTTRYEEAIPEAEVVLICVGTPALKNGKPDLSQVFAAAEQTAVHLAKGTLVAMKSTVPVGTTEEVQRRMQKKTKISFDVASNPEFLREGSAVHDSLHPSRIVMGANTEKARKTLLELHQKLPGERVVTDIATAEMIKYASNAFLATKISFINEMANLCDEMGANVEDVARGMGLDPRIGSGFLKAGIGYGGSCFPKDTRTLRFLSSSHSYNFKLLKAVIEVNQIQRQRFLEKVRFLLGSLKGKKIGVLGLAFKNNTDDVRESAAIDIIEQLFREGAEVKAYDPKASANAKKVLPSLSTVSTPKEAIENADIAVILTEWPEFAKLPWASFKTKMRRPMVLDGRNILNPSQMRKLGFTYHSMGRP